MQNQLRVRELAVLASSTEAGTKCPLLRREKKIPQSLGFDSPIRMGGFMSAALSVASRTLAARAHAAASTRSCPPREFQEVAGTARGPALALVAEPRGLRPLWPSPLVFENPGLPAAGVWCMRPA